MAKNVEAQAPSGFVSLTSVADANWVSLEEGNVVRGELLGLYDREDPRSKTGRSKFFQIRLSDPCKVRVGRGEKVKVEQGEAGDVVNLNYNPHTSKMEPKVDEIVQGAVYEVYIPILGKINLKNGNTMWNMPPSVKCLRKASAVAAPDFTDADNSAVQGGADDEPF